MPDQQKQFAAFAKQYRDSSDAANDLTNPAYQPRRADATCKLFNGNLSVIDWRGNVKDFWRMSDLRDLVSRNVLGA
jgi:hypothetical protein